MSPGNNEDVDLDAIHLGEYLKKEIPVAELKEVSSPQRINSLDFVKGFAIVWIILAHTAGIWLNQEWVFLYGIVFAFMDIVGPSLFVFLSALSVIFSIRKKQGKVPEKLIMYRIITRGVVIMIIGLLFNLISIELTIPGYSFPWTLYGHNIIFFIGFSQIFSYFCLKLTKLWRIILGVISIYASDIIRYYLFIGKEAGNPIIIVFHYLEKEHVRAIAEMFVEELVIRMKQRRISLTYDQAVIDKLAKDGFDPVYGARPLRREVERQVENPLAMKIVRGECPDDSHVHLAVSSDGIVFELS